MNPTSDCRLLSKHFSEHGWCVTQLSDPTPVHDTAAELEKYLRRLLKNKTVTLSMYHQFFAGADDEHTGIQAEMTAFFRGSRFARAIVQANLEIFISLIAHDLNIQDQPYLRITRPGKSGDNIGYHRDTFYGGSPYEISVLIPYVDLPVEASLCVISGSHVQPESDYPTQQIMSPDTVKGSTKHQLGFLYAPKIISTEAISKATLTGVPLRVGQALMFSLSTVHGSIGNQSPITRWSSDVRLVNALAPVDLSARPTYYTPLCRSVVTEQAQKYFFAQERYPS